MSRSRRDNAAFRIIAQQIADAVREGNDATAYNMIERAAAADAQSIIWALANLAANGGEPSPPPQFELDEESVVSTPSGDFLVTFGRDRDQRFTVFLDRVVDGLPEDSPDMHDVETVGDLADRLRELGMSEDEAGRAAVRLWEQATTTIYIRLLDEGVACWRPTEGRVVRHGVYEVTGPVPADETWEFSPGTFVRCEMREFPSSKEVGLTAVESFDSWQAKRKAARRGDR